MKNIIIINSSNYPYGYASVEKIKLIAKGLSLQDFTVYVINMFSTLRKDKYPNHKTIGKSGKSIYIYSSGKACAMKKASKLFLLPYVLIKEACLINRILKVSEERNAIIQYSPFILVIWYFCLSKLLHFNLYINTMEYHVSIKKSLNSKLFDHYSYGLAKGVIVISHFLQQLVLRKFPQKKILILPVTVDHDLFNHDPGKTEDYILFCASAGHIRAIKFVIDSFNYVNNETILLKLILNGTDQQIKIIQEYLDLKSNKRKKIELISELQYNELVKLYMKALVLLIPLYNDERDSARFPHKIGEYTAAGRPILTTNVGEIPYYFENNLNAFILNDISSDSYGNKLNELLNNRSTLDFVGIRGREVGLSYFDYKKQGELLADFLKR